MFCDFSAPLWFLYSSEVPPLLYYSHVPTAIVAVLFGLYIFYKNKESLASKLLLSITALFFFLNLLNLLSWVNIDSRIVTTAWLISQVVYFSLPIFLLYLHYVFIFKKDVRTLYKGIGLLLITILSVMVSLGLTMSYFNTISCELVETPIVEIYQNIVFALVFLLILVSYFIRFRQLKDSKEKRGITIFTVGVIIFLALLIFTWQIASVFDVFEIEQYGLFGMVIFLGFLGYLIVQYKAFDVKVFGAQALIAAIVVLIGAQFFYVKSFTNLILNAIAFGLTLIAGYYLVKSVGMEVKRKEELQKLSDSLAVANDRLKELDTAKSEFISIASHQLRTPLTAIKGYLSLILEGSYGKVPAQIQDVLDKLYTVNNRLTQLVEDLLNVSRIEAGRIQYNFQPTQIEALAAELVDMFALNAKAKGLYLKMQLPKETLPEMLIDPNKIKEVMQNLIDNALKYTPQGGVDVIVENLHDKARIIIKDTGIGIKPEDKDHLFEKFIRSKETTKMVVSGAGLGLYVGKSFVLAHGGNVWAESDGPGKGSRFIIELPFVNPKAKQGVSDQVSALAPQEKKENS